MHTPHGSTKIYLPFLGYQNISNALAASAIAFSLKISLKNIKKGLKETSILSGRLKTIRINSNKILIDDTYNANVASMITAIKVLENMPGYKVLVISDMAELGKNSIIYHKIIGNITNFSSIDQVLSIGKFSYEISKNFHNKKHFHQQEKLKIYLKQIMNNKNPMTFLIKGSRNTKMEKIVEYMIMENKKNDILDK